MSVLAACYSASPAVGVPCSATGDCPTGQRCDYMAVPPTCTASDPLTPDAAPPVEPVCAADTDCDGGACIEHTGMCVPAGNVLFVSTAGADTGECTAAAPCATIGYALGLVANNRRTIAIADGTYAGRVEIMAFGANALTLSGPDRDPAGVTLADGFELAGTTANVTVEGMTIGSTGGRAVENRGNLMLSRVRITGAMVGLFSTGSNTLRVRDSIVDENTGVGIELSQTTLELVGTRVMDNDGGGISIANAATTIESSIIADNGMAFAMFGGVRYQNLNGKPQVFRFNTVANNEASLGPSAVSCPTVLALESSILVGSGGAGALLSAACQPRYSLFAANPPPGTGNRAGNPAFVGNGDFHIGASSAARDAADPAATIARDFDGELRPQGAGRDIGADEIP